MTKYDIVRGNLNKNNLFLILDGISLVLFACKSFNYVDKSNKEWSSTFVVSSLKSLTTRRSNVWKKPVSRASQQIFPKLFLRIRFVQRTKQIFFWMITSFLQKQSHLS